MYVICSRHARRIDSRLRSVENVVAFERRCIARHMAVRY